MSKQKQKNSDFTPCRPDYDVSVKVRSSDYKGKVGAAWKNANGHISIKLQPFVVLDASQDLQITLFPITLGSEPEIKDPGPPEDEPDPSPDGDPIPF